MKLDYASENQCLDCIYCEEDPFDPHTDIIRCRRFPPVLIDGKFDFPSHSYASACGEWREKK